MMPALEAVAATGSGGTTSAGTSPARLPGRRRKLTGALAIAVVLIVLAAAVVRYRAIGPTDAARRRVVVVVPPDNRTGNPALDHIGPMAADWLSRGLLEIGQVQAVPAATAMGVKSGLSAEPGGSTDALSHRVATETGAGLMVSGAYFATGDSIRFQLQLSDVVTDRLIASIDPVSVPVRDPMPGLDVIRRRVAGAVAQSVDPRFEGRATMFVPPPSAEAYQAFTESLVAFSSYDLGKSERLARRALAIDSTYQSARALLSLILHNEGRYRETDSLLQIIEPDQSRLSQTERLTIEHQRAYLNGDHQASYRAAQRMVSVDPSMVWLWILSFESLRLNRPSEALATLARVDPRNFQMDRNWQFWGTVTDAHHMLKHHDRELTAARAARVQYPTLLITLYFEAIALAALDRAPEAERLLDQTVDLPPQAGATLGEVVVDVALEFSAHGDSAAAHRASARALSWYDALPREQQGAERRHYAEALYAGERWLDARRVVDDACRATPVDVACLGMSGTIAARLGERDRAHQIGEQLANLPFYPPKQEGDALLRRSCIAAALGERDLAVTLLRRAFAKGVSYSSALHRQPDLRLLQGYAPFEELLRPKG
jgi:tetratricopeptide (TPR) repeat protein